MEQKNKILVARPFEGEHKTRQQGGGYPYELVIGGLKLQSQ
jgi:hypothetical protein